MTTRRSLILALTAAVGVANAGCGAEGSGSEETIAVATDDAPLVDWETYRASARVVPSGLLVEWDLVFPDEEALYAYWLEEYGSGGRQALTVNRVNVNGIATDDLWPYPQRLDLTYCIGSGFTSQQLTALVPALEAAAEEWSRIAAVRHRRVTVSGTCDQNNNQVTFDIRGVTDAGWTAFAFYPHDTRADRTLRIDGTAFTFTSYGLDLKQIMMHELGHTLGFRHEHIWNTTLPVYCRDAQTNPPPRLVSPAQDQSSVMSYPWCRVPEGEGYWLTPWDIAGVVELYGQAPALINTLTLNLY